MRDLQGLRADTEAGRSAGFFGRSVLHPAQIPVVHEAFAPDPDELARARSLVDGLREGDEAAWIDQSGRFVDAAVVAQARWLLSTTRENGPADEDEPGREDRPINDHSVHSPQEDRAGDEDGAASEDESVHNGRPVREGRPVHKGKYRAEDTRNDEGRAP